MRSPNLPPLSFILMMLVLMILIHFIIAVSAIAVLAVIFILIRRLVLKYNQRQLDKVAQIHSILGDVTNYKYNSNLIIAINQLVAQYGKSILIDKQFLYLLDDCSNLKDYPESRTILQRLQKDGFNQQIVSCKGKNAINIVCKFVEAEQQKNKYTREEIVTTILSIPIALKMVDVSTIFQASDISVKNCISKLRQAALSTGGRVFGVICIMLCIIGVSYKAYEFHHRNELIKEAIAARGLTPSFKGLSIDIPLDSIENIIQASSELTDNFSHSQSSDVEFPSIGKDERLYTNGKKISCSSNFCDKSIDIDIYEMMDTIIGFDIQFYCDSISDIINLYTAKYGIQENQSLFNKSIGTESFPYLWTFRNGTIQIYQQDYYMYSYNRNWHILYSSNKRYIYRKRYDEIKARIQAETDSIEREAERKLKIEQEQQRKLDSISEEQKLKKAYSEI